MTDGRLYESAAGINKMRLWTLTSKPSDQQMSVFYNGEMPQNSTVYRKSVVCGGYEAFWPYQCRIQSDLDLHHQVMIMHREDNLVFAEWARHFTAITRSPNVWYPFRVGEVPRYGILCFLQPVPKLHEVSWASPAELQLNWCFSIHLYIPSLQLLATKRCAIASGRTSFYSLYSLP